MKAALLLTLATVYPLNGQAQPSSSSAQAFPGSFDAVVLTPAQEHSQWLITSKRASMNIVKLSLISTSRPRKILWSHIFADGYSPIVHDTPHWKYNGSSILLFSYQLGAAWEKLTVVGIGDHGPLLLQQIDGAAFDLVYATSSDGNGDLRSLDGADLSRYHCYGWQPVQSRFAEQPCRSLKQP